MASQPACSPHPQWQYKDLAKPVTKPPVNHSYPPTASSFSPFSYWIIPSCRVELASMVTTFPTVHHLGTQRAWPRMSWLPRKRGTDRRPWQLWAPMFTKMPYLTRSLGVQEWCRKLWVHQGTDSSNPPHHSHSFLLEAPYQMNTENICHWWISMCWNIHALLRILQRNTAALQSQFNILETWHGKTMNTWRVKRWAPSRWRLPCVLWDLLEQLPCPVRCNGKNVAKNENVFDSGTETTSWLHQPRPQIEWWCKTKSIDFVFGSSRSTMWKLEKFQSSKTSPRRKRRQNLHNVSTRFELRWYIFFTSKNGNVFWKKLGNSCRIYHWQLVSLNLICYVCLES